MEKSFLKPVNYKVSAWCVLIVCTFSTYALEAVEDKINSNKSNKSSSEFSSPRVRLKLSLKPYGDVKIRSLDGSIIQRSMAKQSLEHVLRARMDSNNHFYVSDFHVETIPLKWVKSTGKYTMQVNVYKKFGTEADSVEEKIASTKLEGSLIENSPNLYTFIGKKEESFVSITGDKTLELLAGFSRDEIEQNPVQEGIKSYSKLDPESKTP